MDGIFHSSPDKLRSFSSEVVRYEIFMLQEDKEIHDEDLENCMMKCLALATTLTSEYIWNNEGFNLCVGKSDGMSCLVGETDFGDFIEDEWIIVSILYRITELFQYLTCRVHDADGNFLLIEAADNLPKWLTVDTSKNRVFIHGGHLHIVCQPRNPGEISRLPMGQPTLKSGLQTVYKYPGLTRAHISIEKCIQKRMTGYPERAIEFAHKANVFLPEIIVRLLDKDPNLISAAIRAFYYRDPVDLRACRIFKNFLPDTRVWSQIPMNRCGYAQLMQQMFTADKRSGYTMAKSAGADFKGMDLGCKIAHGFEILCANSTKRQADKMDPGTFDETSFEKYIEALRKRDYFHGEIEGSKRFKELLTNAKVFFSKFYNESSENDSSISWSTGRKILDMRKSIVTQNPLTRLSSAGSRSDLPEEDSDSWMYLNDEKMNDLLTEMNLGFQRMNKKTSELRNDEELELDDLCGKMQNFVNKMSGYEGIESSIGGDNVNLDPDTFNDVLRRLFDGPNQNRDPRDSSDEFLSSEDESEEDSKDVATMEEVMNQMDTELASTDVGKSFIEENGSKDEDFEPVNIDMNLVKNFLKSCESETSIPGAATTLLNSIGLDSDKI